MLCNLLTITNVLFNAFVFFASYCCGHLQWVFLLLSLLGCRGIVIALVGGQHLMIMVTLHKLSISCIFIGMFTTSKSWTRSTLTFVWSFWPFDIPYVKWWWAATPCELDNLSIVTLYGVMFSTSKISAKYDIDFCATFLNIPSSSNIPVKPLHNHDIVSVHFNHFILHGDLR